ncbi:MAG TPA: hypothetical protein DEO70_12205 [Bacteroidales bacterium]|nr:MAG: hypothetical protein A2X11_10195 [Bacteroidetes bacterium GWE2_42_24]OFY25881.1 MAG: hypothetical protein A2X09_09570 [Bacteroidetes bacterium GWF2_43_11]HBZ67591.1 hypothetical protein [Bacteroidales bacterium]
MKKYDPERHRQRLSDLMAQSNKVAQLVKEGTFNTINEALIECIYKADGHNEFYSFNEWKKRGARVKKGSEAFCLWGQPIPRTVKRENGEEDEKDFFPMAYVFSNLQVVTEDTK